MDLANVYAARNCNPWDSRSVRLICNESYEELAVLSFRLNPLIETPWSGARSWASLGAFDLNVWPVTALVTGFCGVAN